jgi:translation initiation factor IF-2
VTSSPKNFPVRDIPPVPGRELNAAAPFLAAATPGNATPARENAATASPRGDRGTASVPAAPPAGAEAHDPAGGAITPAPLAAESAPDGTSPVPGAECGQVEPPSRVPVSPAATAAAALGGSRGTQKPASGPSPGQPGVAGGQAGPSPAAARAATARATSGSSGSSPRWGQRGGTAGPERGPGPASASSSADQGPAEEEKRPAGDARSSAASPAAGQEFRDTWKAARSASAKGKRTARGKWPVKRQAGAYRPGMTRRMPPGSAS